MIRSKTNIEINDSNFKINKNFGSFNDFNILNLGGSQKLLSFGEYCAKNKFQKKENKRKVIYYFYKNLNKRIKI